MKNSASRASLKGKEPAVVDPFKVVDLVKSLSVSDCRILNTPNLIFLCGGQTTVAGPYLSVRDFFYRHLLGSDPSLSARVKLAEEVNLWFHSNPVFPDLLELETYLADLSDLTILFVESPGSIAELGAFSNSDALRPKTLAVLNSIYDNKPSFIVDGPIKKIQNHDERLIYWYTWNPDDLNSADTLAELQAMAQDLVAVLKMCDNSRDKKPSFRFRSHGHVLLLVADLIRVSGIATSSDISECLDAIGHDSHRDEVNRCLSLLESLGFIKRRRKGLQKFYLSTIPTPFIQYVFKRDARYRDMQRVMSALRESLDPERRGVLRREFPTGTPNV